LRKAERIAKERPSGSGGGQRFCALFRDSLLGEARGRDEKRQGKRAVVDAARMDLASGKVSGERRPR